MIYYYGGAFDPFTNAHRQIVKCLMNRKGEDDIVVIGVTENDEKEFKVSQHNRMSLVRRSLDEEWFKNGLSVMPQNERTWRHLQTNFPRDAEITLVMGEDEFQALVEGKWVHSDKLIRDYQFKVFSRPKTGVPSILKNPNYAHIKYQVHEFTDAKYEGISSTNVRDIFYRNPATTYKEVQNYITIGAFKCIKDRGLYWQNGEEYAKEEAEFLKEYAKKKVENNWGEPSVTTDTIAYNGDKILLIRRLKPPYKNYWALPGGFFEKTDEDLDAGAARELLEETSMRLDARKFHQVKTYGHNFDPRMKIVDVAFSVRVPHSEMKRAKADDDAAALHWFNLDDLPNLAFHHARIIADWQAQRNEE